MGERASIGGKEVLWKGTERGEWKWDECCGMRVRGVANRRDV
jgi:hypothetical protein